LARSNSKRVHAFTKHLAQVFQPHPTESETEDEKTLTLLLEKPYQLEPPINRLKRDPGYDLITSRDT
jgi:hypothetical protein